MTPEKLEKRKKLNKKILLFFLGIFGLLLAIGMLGSQTEKSLAKAEVKPETAPAPVANEQSDKEKVEALVSEEPKIKDYVLTDAHVLYVSVVDDGTRRDGYAEYLCMAIKDRGIQADRVKVVEWGSMQSPDRDNAYGILLGESWCK